MEPNKTLEELLETCAALRKHISSSSPQGPLITALLARVPMLVMPCDAAAHLLTQLAQGKWNRARRAAGWQLLQLCGASFAQTLASDETCFVALKQMFADETDAAHIDDALALLASMATHAPPSLAESSVVEQLMPLLLKRALDSEHEAEARDATLAVLRLAAACYEDGGDAVAAKLAEKFTRQLETRQDDSLLAAFAGITAVVSGTLILNCLFFQSFVLLLK